MKPRSDAKLKTLPEERQGQIAGFARDHSLTETRVWLKEDGLVTSEAALSEFLSWWELEQQLSRNESTVEQVLGQLKRSDPGLTEAQLFAAGQSFFSALAIETRDAKTWKRTQDLKFKGELLALEEKKFQRETCELFLKWARDQKALEITEGKASNSEKIEALRALMFADVES